MILPDTGGVGAQDPQLQDPARAPSPLADHPTRAAQRRWGCPTPRMSCQRPRTGTARFQGLVRCWQAVSTLSPVTGVVVFVQGRAERRQMKHRNPSELSHPRCRPAFPPAWNRAHCVCGAGAARTAVLGSAIPTTRKRRSLGCETRGSGRAPPHWPFPRGQHPKPNEGADERADPPPTADLPCSIRIAPCRESVAGGQFSSGIPGPLWKRSW